MDCKERLESYLRENKVAFEVQEHPATFTAQEVAASEHVSGRMFAKVVMVMADGALRMLVLPASERVDLGKARSALGASKVRLATETEFAAAFSGCAAGAMPPFGHLYGLRVHVDEALGRNERIVFQVGTHTATVRMRYADYAELERPSVADLAAEAAPA